MNNDIFLQITAGLGPKECAWVVAQVVQRIEQSATEYHCVAERAHQRAFDKHLRKQDLIEPDTFQSVLLQITGANANQLSEHWCGTLCWLGTSSYRPAHKRSRWFVAVNEVDCAEVEQLGIDERDVRFEVIRARGPGGQHVNKTDTAVRALHLPSGLSLREESERSQFRNKQRALKRLEALLHLAQIEQGQQQKASHRDNHFQVQRGRAKRTFVGPDFIEKDSS